MVRPKKRGQRRIDAAIDALVPIGFSKTNIRRAINQLLKVYGGDEGWVFIEEASYKLLIDKLLDEEGQNKETKEEEANKTLPGEPSMQIMEAAPHAVQVAAEEEANKTWPGEPSLQLLEIAPPAVQVAAVTIRKRPPPAVQVAAVTIRKRPPCYGWISESESETDSEDHVEENGANHHSSGDLHHVRK